MSYEGLDASFASRLKALIDASGGRVSIYSGYRSVETQTELWNESLTKYGSEDAARQWVAPPGKSNHNHGWAADLGYVDGEAREWVHANASRFGLHFPMSWEPWHIEPAEARGRAAPEAYTLPTDGELPVDEPTRRMDPGYQMMSFMGILHSMGQADMGGGRVDPAATNTQSTMNDPLPGFGEALRSIPGSPAAQQPAQHEHEVA